MDMFPIDEDESVLRQLDSSRIFESLALHPTPLVTASSKECISASARNRASSIKRVVLLKRTRGALRTKGLESGKCSMTVTKNDDECSDV